MIFISNRLLWMSLFGIKNRN